MPRAGTPNARIYYTRDAAKQKANGFARGPRITAEAAESLRALSYHHRLTPGEVVSRLLTGKPLADRRDEVRLSPAELREWEVMVRDPNA